MAKKSGSKSASKSSTSSNFLPQVSHPALKQERVMLPRPEVSRKTGRSRTMHYDDIQRGVMTPPVALGPRRSGWPEHEVDAILSARIAGATDDDVRQIVKRLMEERRSALPGFTPTPSQKKPRARDARGRLK